MAKTPKRNGELKKRIAKKNESLQNMTDKAADSLIKLGRKFIIRLGVCVKNVIGAFSIDDMGKFAKKAAHMQEIADEWVNITLDQFEEDRKFICIHAKKAFNLVKALVSIDSDRGLAPIMAKIISRHDFVQGVIFDNFSFIFARLKEKVGKQVAYMWEERMVIVRYAACGALVLICMISVFNYATGYEYSYNGRTLGLVKEQDDVAKVLDAAATGLTKEYGVDVQIDINRDFSFRKVVIMNRHTDNDDEVLAKLTYMQDARALASGIFADGKKVAVVDSKRTANEVLEEIIDRYTDSDKKYEYVGFKEDVNVEETYTTLGKLMSEDTAEKRLLAGKTPEEYEAKRGDSLKSISEDKDIPIQLLKALNPSAKKRMEEGEKVLVTDKEPLVTVVTKQKEKRYKKMDFKVKKIKSDNLYEGVTEVHQRGKKGKMRITSLVTRENGVKVGSVNLNTKVLKEPVTKIVYVGTKKRPSYIGSGHLINPCPAGYWSSGFGQRWGRLHRGIDMACAAGNPIYAADGGIVITASFNYSYGNYVKINHQNGMITTYAHCSALLVHVGQKVAQGEQIARVGSTGNSTGAHCHFEVEVNGVLKNPANYL